MLKYLMYDNKIPKINSKEAVLTLSDENDQSNL